MRKLNETEKAQLAVMKAVGFPVEDFDGAWAWDEDKVGRMPRMHSNRNTVHITDDFSQIVAVYEFWKRHKRNEN
jgi:hypothetical protein